MDHHISPILTVPNEILYEIAKYLPTRCVISLLRANRTFYLPLRSLLISQNKNEILLFAAQRNNLNLLTVALSAGADPSYQTRQYYDPTFFNNAALHRAAAGGYTEIIAELLRYNPSLEACGNNNETPLLCAAWKGQEAAVDLLIAAGCDPTSLGRDSSTLLRAAITNGLGRTAIAYIEQMDDNSLKEAIQCKRLKIVKLMLARGADIAGLLPTAAVSGIEYVKLCVDAGARINDVDRMTRCTPLALAVMHGHSDVVAYLLGLGANPEKGPKKKRPIMIAAYHGKTEIMRQLLDHGVDLEGLRNPFVDVLVTACVSSPPELVAMLLDSGVVMEIDGRPNEERRQGPLHVAAECGNLAVIRLLLERGAVVNAGRGPKLETPLHWAARAARVEAVEVLLTGGADPYLECQGITPLLMASRSWKHPDRRMKTMAALVRAGANINELGTKSRTEVIRALAEEEQQQPKSLTEGEVPK